MTTNSKLAAIQAFANAAAENDIDMNEVVQGGGAAELIEGNHFCRLVQYVSIGSHVQEFDGQKKPAAPMFYLGFEVFQIDRSGEKPKVLEGVLRRTRNFTISQNEKATSHKLFKRLNYKGTAKHFYQMLGEAFILPVRKETLTKGKNAGKEVIREQWMEIQAAVDPVSGTPYNVPDFKEENLKLFLFEQPTKEAWDSLFIDGKNDKGESKNWIQDRIVSATNYPGSALEALIGGGGIPDLSADLPAEKAAVKAEPAAALEVPVIPDIPAL